MASFWGALWTRNKRWYLWAAVLALGSVALMMRVGWLILQQPCQGSTDVGSDCSSLTAELVPLAVALGFWAAGLVAWGVGQSGPTVSFYFLLADALTVGKLTESGIAIDLSMPLFYLLLAWLAPLSYHFSLSLLDNPPRKAARYTLIALYVASLVWSIPLLVWSYSALQEHGSFVILRTGIRLNLAVAFILSWLLLGFEYSRHASAAIRQRIRLITFGTLLAFAPLLLLSLLPETFGAPAHVPYEYTFPWLLLSPLAYLYSLFRGQLVPLEPRLNRAAVYYLLVVMLLSIYLLAVSVLDRLVTSMTMGWTLLNAFLSVGLVLLFASLKRGVEKLITWILYGSETTYSAVVGQLAEGLALALKRETLCHILIDELSAAMRLDKILLLLADADQKLTLAGAIGIESSQIENCIAIENGELSSLLRQVAKPIPNRQLRKTLAGRVLTEQENSLLALDGISYWLPLVSGGALQGLLLTGNRIDNGALNSEDERILATLAHQAGIAVYNIRLVEESQAREKELEHAHQGMVLAREQEQRRLARELHDGAVQQLLALSHQIYQNQRRQGNGKLSPEPQNDLLSLDAIREGMVSVVSQLRALIGDMRPAGLEEFGLAAALQGYVGRLEREAGCKGPCFRVNIEDDSSIFLSESIKLCLFRSAQEALRNALKHAYARCIQLDLYIDEEAAELVVQDDGCGFKVPAPLGKLAQNNHFGLIGLAERVAWAGGALEVASRPGAGTRVSVQIPIGKVNQDNGNANSSAISG